METLLRGAKAYIDGKFVLTDVLVGKSDISFLSPNEDFSKIAPSAIPFEFNDKYIFPGFADVHVHFREPGFLYKEDIASGSLAAAAGGYTHVFTMPNLNPVPDCRKNLEIELDAIREKAVINVYPYASITKGELGLELSALDELDAAAAYSDDGVGVVSDELMKQAMLKAKSQGKVISAHCEYKSLMGGKNVHAGKAADALGIEGISSESEWKMIERDLKLAGETGCAYHVCHISTKESVDLIRKAKACGINVTCETGPHYLLLSEETIVNALNDKEESGRKYGLGRFKMNPPLRSEEDRRALLEGLADGTIDMIATDHAPHSTEEKSKGFDGPMGVVGLECAFPVLYTGLVRTGFITLERLIELMYVNPMKRFGLLSSGKNISAGNLCVYDLDKEYTIDPDTFRSKGRFTPFDKNRVYGKCLMTICNGEIVYNAASD